MNDWIPFENATYLVEEAFLVANDDTAVSVERTSIEVYTGKGGKKRLKGSGLIQNALMVELLEESDDLDLILDLGGEFKYLMKAPKISKYSTRSMVQSGNPHRGKIRVVASKMIKAVPA